MKKQSLTTARERKIKFAEAGILFVLILAIAVFVGVRLVDNDETTLMTEPTAVTEVMDTEVTPEPLIDTESVVAANSDSLVISEAVTVEPIIETPREVTYASAEQAYFDGDYSDSAEQFTIYADEHPDNAWGFYMLGLATWKNGDNAGAESAFQEALTLKPDHQKSLVNYARVLLDMDRAADAKDQIDIALAINPASVSANRVNGRIQHTLGQLDDAAASYHQVLRSNADDVWALNNLGLILIEKEQFTDALAPLAKAAGIRSDVACIQNNLGVALERTGHFTDAAQAFELALDADDTYAKAEINRDRVDGRTEAADLDAIDLIALADAFTVQPIDPIEITEPVDVATAAEAEAEPASGDMEVAAALSSTQKDDALEIDDRQNR